MAICMLIISLLSVFAVNAWPATYAINAGGPTYTDSTGRVYEADMHFSGGAIDNEAEAFSIAGTMDDTLYQSWRWGLSFAYALPVANGDYQVMLQFAENVHTQAGKRTFNVSLEGVEALHHLDIYAEAGASHTAHDVTLPVTVSDGVLNLAFKRVVGNAMVSAIVVTATAPPPIEGHVTLSWQAVEGATGYRVYQSTDQGVTWAMVADVSVTTATVVAPTSGLVLYRASAYTPAGEMVRTHAGAWVNQSEASSGGPSLGIP